MLVMQMMKILNLVTAVDAKETKWTAPEVDWKQCDGQKAIKG